MPLLLVEAKVKNILAQLSHPFSVCFVQHVQKSFANYRRKRRSLNHLPLRWLSETLWGLRSPGIALWKIPKPSFELESNCKEALISFLASDSPQQSRYLWFTCEFLSYVMNFSDEVWSFRNNHLSWCDGWRRWEMAKVNFLVLPISAWA